MAIVDVERNAVVICIAYLELVRPGALGALAKCLGRELERCADDAGVGLEHLEYVGGHFEGHQLCCRVFSIPASLPPARRSAMLDSADVVACVIDGASRDSVAAGAAAVREVVDELLAEPRSVVVPIVAQVVGHEAAPGELGPLRDALAALGEASAICDIDLAAGAGVREGFGLAVHLATERMRKQVRVRTAPIATAPRTMDTTGDVTCAAVHDAMTSSAEEPADEAATSDATLSQEGSVTSAPDASLPVAPSYATAIASESQTATAPGLTPLSAADPSSAAADSGRRARAPSLRVRLDEIAALVRSEAATGPRLPDLDVARNAIWPPLEGRLMLVEVVSAGLAARRGVGGDWEAEDGVWRALSYAADEHGDPELGRRALVAWASEHGRLSRLLSPRCVMLAATGLGTWRLWQLVRHEPSLRTWLQQAAALDVVALYGKLLRAAAALSEVYLRSAGTRLVSSADTVSIGRLGATYRDFMPPVGQPAPSGDTRAQTVEAVVARQLATAIASTLSERRTELQRSIPALWTGHTPWEAVVTAAVAAAR